MIQSFQMTSSLSRDIAHSRLPAVSAGAGRTDAHCHEPRCFPGSPAASAGGGSELQTPMGAGREPCCFRGSLEGPVLILWEAGETLTASAGGGPAIFSSGQPPVPVPVCSSSGDPVRAGHRGEISILPGHSHCPLSEATPPPPRTGKLRWD